MLLDVLPAWIEGSTTAVGAPGVVFDPALSPDEKSVAFRRQTINGSDLWLRDLARGTETRFTSDVSTNVAPFWSPKGDRIVFNSNRNGAVYNLFQKAASGSGQDEVLLTNGNNKASTQWSPDGRFIVYSEADRPYQRVRIRPARKSRTISSFPGDGRGFTIVGASGQVD